jgi:hypothetical protein
MTVSLTLQYREKYSGKHVAFIHPAATSFFLEYFSLCCRCMSKSINNAFSAAVSKATLTSRVRCREHASISEGHPIDCRPIDWLTRSIGTPDLLAPDQLAPDRLAPDRLAPDRLAPDRLAPDRLFLAHSSAKSVQKGQKDIYSIHRLHPIDWQPIDCRPVDCSWRTAVRTVFNRCSKSVQKVCKKCAKSVQKVCKKCAKSVQKVCKKGKKRYSTRRLQKKNMSIIEFAK